jgi:uncharacterized protein YegL
MMTDGEPTDDIDLYLPAFKSYKWGIVVACGAGPNVDNSVLQKIAGENVLHLATCDSQSLTAFFKFMSTSIATSSKKVDLGKSVSNLKDLPPLPSELLLLKY